MANLIVQVMLVGAIILFLAASTYLKKLYNMLNPGRVRNAWFGLAVLLALAVVGCVIFVGLNATEGSNHHEDWLVASVFLVAAGFVFTVCALSCSTAKDIARLAELEQAVYFDPLTKLYSRSKILSILEAECIECQEKTTAVSVMMLDIDDFKFINDCYGHQAGDKVLEQIGQVLAEVRGKANFVGRYGGEEFLMVLPNTLPFHATAVAEHIRGAVAGKAFSLGEETVNLTISIGIATTVTFRETCDDLIACADRALYIAKLAGRDKALHSEELSVRKPVGRAEISASDFRMLSEDGPLE